MPVQDLPPKSSLTILKDSGLHPRKPAIRSSDYGLCLRDPLRYYIARRLGLVPALEWSPALNRGTWFHHVLAMYDWDPQTRWTTLQEILHGRKQEIAELCSEVSKNPEPLQEREEKDMLTAKSWWDAACCKIPINEEHGTLEEYLKKDCFQLLGVEVYLICPGGNYTDVAQADLLMYNKETNQVWIIDGKTCGGSASGRLKTCSIEFQTLHYINVCHKLMRFNTLQDTFDIPANATLGGMIHAAVQKCPLEFGRDDRPYTEHEHELLRGPRKGEVETRRTYEGEPTFDNYLQRQSEWYSATGRYAHRATELADDPPVQLSFTYAKSARDDRHRQMYNAMHNVVTNYQGKDPKPELFPPSADNLRPFRGSKISAYAPFYLMPPAYWSDIVRRDGFKQVDRDAGLDLTQPACIAQEDLR